MSQAARDAEQMYQHREQGVLQQAMTAKGFPKDLPKSPDAPPGPLILPTLPRSPIDSLLSGAAPFGRPWSFEGPLTDRFTRNPFTMDPQPSVADARTIHTPVGESGEYAGRHGELGYPTGARYVEEFDPKAEQAYQQIRNDPMIGPKVAQNLGVPLRIVRAVIQHQFVNDHPMVENGALAYRKFTPDLETAQEWWGLHAELCCPKKSAGSKSTSRTST